MGCKENSIEDLPGEIWIAAKGFEGRYIVSSLGRVRSLDYWAYREVCKKDILYRGKILSQCYCKTNGQPMVTLYGNGKFPQPVYLIVFFSFNPHIEKKKGWEVDHIDQDRSNSNLSNLQYITARENSLKRSLHKKDRTSQFPGVSIDRKRNKWQTGVRYKGGNYSLGAYVSEEEAAGVYQAALAAIKEDRFEDFISARKVLNKSKVALQKERG